MESSLVVAALTLERDKAPSSITKIALKYAITRPYSMQEEIAPLP